MGAGLMADLVAFLAARLDEDERIAQGAARTDDGLGGDWIPAAIAGKWLSADARVDDHVAAHDPARVLREVAAKRQIIGQHQLLKRPEVPAPGTVPMSQLAATLDAASAWPDEEVCQCRSERPCPDLLSLASAYSDHPDYDPAWSAE